MTSCKISTAETSNPLLIRKPLLLKQNTSNLYSNAEEQLRLLEESQRFLVSRGGMRLLGKLVAQGVALDRCLKLVNECVARAPHSPPLQLAALYGRFLTNPSVADTPVAAVLALASLATIKHFAQYIATGIATLSKDTDVCSWVARLLALRISSRHACVGEELAAAAVELLSRIAFFVPRRRKRLLGLADDGKQESSASSICEFEDGIFDTVSRACLYTKESADANIEPTVSFVSSNPRAQIAVAKLVASLAKIHERSVSEGADVIHASIAACAGVNELMHSSYTREEKVEVAKWSWMSVCCACRTLSDLQQSKNALRAEEVKDRFPAFAALKEQFGIFFAAELFAFTMNSDGIQRSETCWMARFIQHLFRNLHLGEREPRKHAR